MTANKQRIGKGIKQDMPVKYSQSDFIIKEICISCGWPVKDEWENTWVHYLRNGNFCDFCGARAEEAYHARQHKNKEEGKRRLQEIDDRITKRCSEPPKSPL